MTKDSLEKHFSARLGNARFSVAAPRGVVTGQIFPYFST